MCNSTWFQTADELKSCFSQNECRCLLDVCSSVQSPPDVTKQAHFIWQTAPLRRNLPDIDHTAVHLPNGHIHNFLSAGHMTRCFPNHDIYTLTNTTHAESNATLTLYSCHTKTRTWSFSASLLFAYKKLVSEFILFPTLTAVRVVRSQIEEAMFAAIAALTVHVLFTDALTAQRITQTATLRTGPVAVTCCNTGKSELWM